MNERIKALAVEAGMIFGDGSEFDMTKFMSKELKFAELIVQECLMKAIGAKIRGESIDTLIENIKEDFGVEE
jgi:HEPN domain-containing protein